MRFITQKSLRTRLALFGAGALMALSSIANGQVSNYLFSQSSATYTPITGGSLIVANSDASPGGNDSAAMDDFGYAAQAIPFPFTFNGTAYTSFRAGSNGYIYFGTSAVTHSVPISSTSTTYTGAISGLGVDLNGPGQSTGDLTSGSTTITNVGSTTSCSVGATIIGTGIPAGATIASFTANSITLSTAATATGTATTINWTAGEIRVETVGTAPNRTCVIQFKNVALYATNNMGFNFQIRLNEGGGVAANQSIQVVYGNCYLMGTATSTAQVGLRGASASDYNNRTTTTSWAASTAGASNSSSFAISSTILPASGLTFTWTPATCITPTLVNTMAVTATTATLNWTAASPTPSSGYQYEVRSSGAAGSGATGLAASGTTGAGIVTANVTGLTSATTYSVYVRSNCGASFSNWTVATAFTTSCLPTAIPYIQGFDAAGLPSCWTTSLVSGTTAWSSVVGNSGDISTSHSGAGFMEKNYPTSQSVLYSPAFNLTTLPAGGQARVKMWLYRNSLAHANDRIQVYVNNSASLTGALPLLDIYTLATIAPIVPASGWYEYVVNVPTSFNTSSNVYVIYQGTTTAGFSSYDLGVDDFTIEQLPSCGDPTSVTTTAVTATTATINWLAPATAPASGYQYEVRTSGVAGSGATGLTTSGSTLAGVITANISGLTPATTYSVYVRSNCGTGFSPWTVVTTFTTTLDCSTATPIICGTGTVVTIAAGTGAYANSSCGYTTPGIERLYSFTPSITGNYTLSVTAATGGYIDYMFRDAATGCGPTGWTCIDDISAAVDNSIALTAGTTYLFLLDPENTTGVSQTFVMKCCFSPTTLTATAITTTGASLGWTGAASQWQVQWGTPTFTLGLGTNVFTSTNPYVLGGLTAATSYSFYVRAICGAGDTSVWSPRFVFSTACSNATLPFAENFAAYPASVCWSEATGAFTGTTTLTGTSSAWSSDDWLNVSGNNSAKINIYNNAFTAIRDWMITPTIDFGTGGRKVLEFNLGMVRWNTTIADTLGSDDTVAVVISTNNGASWSMANAVKVFTAANPPTGANGTERYYIPLNGYSGLVKIGFYGSQGNIADTKDIDVFVDSILVTNCTVPTVALGNDTTLCPAKTMTLNSGTGSEYLWSTGAITPSINISAAGTYWVKTTNGSKGCFNTDTVVVAAGVDPVVTLGNDTTICPNATVTLNAGNAGSTYAWNNATTGQTLNATAAGTYFVTVKNAAACTASDTLVITNGVVPVVALGNDTAICAGQSLTLNAGTASSYLWSNNATTPTISVTAAGTYYVAVTSSTACQATDTIVITVNPVASVTTITPAITMPSVAFTSDAANVITYAWDFGDNSTDATATPTHVYTANGTYTVRLIARNDCGSDTAFVNITITGVGVKTTVGTNETIKLYPNPAINNVVMESAGTIMTSYSIINSVGVVVTEGRVMNAHKESIDISAIPSGTYMVRVTTNAGIINQKLQIVR